ncbi:hypothetical protein DFH08DRAFT_966521 [Mycena albidolilacea]|uniref:Uncharacterized protein n=1 Tax=Mycena albidolilacea TaxID=1033008 RepID=A0AAD6ZPA1_9AGAR|nr:hypothetical protein DFH08DRAFT_966521 [Mycena albidolilacea]
MIDQEVPKIAAIDEEALNDFFLLCHPPAQFPWVEERLVPASRRIRSWAAVEGRGKDEAASHLSPNNSRILHTTLNVPPTASNFGNVTLRQPRLCQHRHEQVLVCADAPSTSPPTWTASVWGSIYFHAHRKFKFMTDRRYSACIRFTCAVARPRIDFRNTFTALRSQRFYRDAIQRVVRASDVEAVRYLSESSKADARFEKNLVLVSLVGLLVPLSLLSSFVYTQCPPFSLLSSILYTTRADHLPTALLPCAPLPALDDDRHKLPAFGDVHRTGAAAAHEQRAQAVAERVQAGGIHLRAGLQANPRDVLGFHHAKLAGATGHPLADPNIKRCRSLTVWATHPVWDAILAMFEQETYSVLRALDIMENHPLEKLVMQGMNVGDVVLPRMRAIYRRQLGNLSNIFRTAAATTTTPAVPATTAILSDPLGGLSSVIAAIIAPTSPTTSTRFEGIYSTPATTPDATSTTPTTIPTTTSTTPTSTLPPTTVEVDVTSTMKASQASAGVSPSASATDTPTSHSAVAAAVIGSRPSGTYIAQALLLHMNSGHGLWQNACRLAAYVYELWDTVEIKTTYRFHP